MSSLPVSLHPPKWPPLLTGSRLPFWVTLRDISLTLLAWALLGWLLRHPIYVAYDYLRHPIFKLTTAKPLDVAVLLWRLRYFWTISAVLVVWLWLWAIIDRKRLRAATVTPQPAPLAIPEQAAPFGVAPEAIPPAREFKIANVLFREDGTISGFEQRPVPAEFRQTSAARQAD